MAIFPQFLKEQAALSAAEITAESVIEFAAKSDMDGGVEISDNSKGTKHTCEEMLKNVKDVSSRKKSSDDTFQFPTGSHQVPKVNGKHNKHMQHVSLKAKGETLSQGNGVAKMIFANIPMFREVLPGLEGWRATKVASWHNLAGHSIQWFCVVCIDRTGNLITAKLHLGFRFLFPGEVEKRNCLIACGIGKFNFASLYPFSKLLD